MEKISNYVYGIVCLVVIVLIICTAVIPVVENSQSSMVTEANNTGFKFVADSSDDLTLNIAYDSVNLTVTVGDKVYPTTDFTLGDFVLASSNVLIRTHNNGSLQIFDVDNNIKYASVANYSIVGGVCTYTASSTEYTVELDGPVYYLSDKGSFGQFKRSADNTFSIKVNDNSQISLVCADSFASPWGSTTVIQNGTIKDGTTSVLGVRYNNDTSSFDEIQTVTVTYTSVDNEDKSYTLTGASIYLNDGVNETTQGNNRINSIFAPISYVYVTEEQSMITALLGVIPLVLLIVPIMYVVGLISTRRD